MDNDYLYKFVRFPENEEEPHSLNIIRNNQIFFCSAKYLNDPFELKADHYLGDNDFENSYAKKMVDLAGHSQDSESARKFINTDGFIEKVANHLLDNFCVLSTSKISQDGVYDGKILEMKDNLLFAYYSGGHTGFCIEFKGLSALFESGFEKVSYQEECPRIDLSQEESAITEDICNMFSVKQSSWEHEREWRMVLHKLMISTIEEFKGSYVVEDKGITLKIPENLISSVILGNKCSKENVKVITEIISGRNISLYKTQQHKRRYQFILEQIT